MAEVALRDYVNEIDGMIENSAFDVAIQHGRHILSLYSRYLEVYRVLGKALLEKDDYAGAGDIYQRVLGVDPEDFVARVGLSIVHDKQGELDHAIWHMERAYDLMPGNEIIQSELRRLCGRRDGSEPERVSLTRSALARMYANGDLTDEAITNLRQMLQDQPDRFDLQVLLAEMLWRDNQRIEASDLAQGITAKLPYCLKANLILGEILQASGSSDSETPLRRAQAVDPDNLQAAQLFGSESPLPVHQTLVARMEQLSYGQLLETDGTTTHQEEVPDWLRGLSELNTPVSQLEPPESAVNPPLPTGLHMPGTEPLRGEIPDWLQGLTVQQPEPVGPSQELPGWLTALGTASMPETPAKPTSTEPADDWLAQLPTTNAPEPVTAMRDEDVPDWILQLGTGELDPRKLPQAEPAADESPNWMKQPGATVTRETAPSESPAIPMAEEVPDWLRQLAGTGQLDQPAATESVRPSTEPAESTDAPDWLRKLNTGPLDQTVVSAGPLDETPDWLSQLQATVPPVDRSPAEETPDWLAQLGNTGPLPGGETPLPSRKISVDADRATIERLVDAFAPSETMPAESAVTKSREPSFSLGDAASEAGKAGAGLVLGGAALAGAAASGLAGLVKGHDDQPVEAAPVSPESAPEVPESTALEAASSLEGDVSPDDALAFFARLSAGKEEQLRAEAEAEGESRMAAIMGRKAEPAQPIEPEPVAEIEAAPAEEVPEWLSSLGSTVVTEPAASTPVDDLPEWLRGLRPTEGAVAEQAAEPLAETPPLPAGDVSPDDALAFFARLSAGKEEQLRAEAEAEGESRMAAIMGRKPTAPLVETEPVEPVAEIVSPLQMAVPEAAEPTAVEASAILEGDVSPDDALAFFARLSAGKEDQLRAEAEAEGESRMATIMGRKPTAPLAEAKPVEPEPVAEIVVTPQLAVPEVPEPTTLEAAAILEGDISPDDALAFFARLSAGKEDQLRAEAEAEGESRMAAIMGRKPTAPLAEARPVEPEPAAEIVVPPQLAVPEVPEPTTLEAAAILEGDISPDDALAFFARLSAGKEDQLRAEAEAEGESRMAAIMGRKTVEPEKPIELAVPAASIEPEPEEVASMDGTTDWLAQLSAAAASTAAEPASEIAEEEPHDWLKGLGEAAPVLAADEVPDWLRAMRPPDEALVTEPGLASEAAEIEATPAEELPAWLRSMQPVAEVPAPVDDEVTDEIVAAVETVTEGSVADATPLSELPDWLQNLQPSTVAAELTPAEALPDWLRNLQPETIEVVAEPAAVSEPITELPQAEELPAMAQASAAQQVAAQQVATPVEEVAPLAEGLPEPILTPVSVLMQPVVAEVEPESAALPALAASTTPTWWTQSAGDEGEAPIAELPEPVRMVSPTARMTSAASRASSAVPSRPPLTRAMRDRLPERTRRREVRPAAPRGTEAPAPAVSSVNVDPLVEQLEADKFNHVVRLELARAWWSMGNRDSALAEYGKLVNPAQVENLSDEELAEIEERDFAEAGPLANDLIADLERIVEIDQHPTWPRLLGDLYMKTGDLAQALEMYRRALSQL